MTGFDIDLGPLPPPVEQDLIWANRLWNALRLEETDGGIWDFPTVGRYQRTGGNELTLIEIHASNKPDQIGASLWNKHDWVCLLAYAIGWEVVSDQVRKADTIVVDGEANEPNLEDIGSVMVCDCGLIYSLQGSHTTNLRLNISESGECLNSNCQTILPEQHRGVLNVVDDSVLMAKMDAQEQLAIAIDEDDYPLPPVEVLTESRSEEE